jgi:hypothetical protein
MEQVAAEAHRLIFPGLFLANPLSGWRVERAETAEGTLVYLDKPGLPKRVWRFTGRYEYSPTDVLFEGVWPD